MESFTHIHLLVLLIFSILFAVSGNGIPTLAPLNYSSIMQARERFMSIDPSKLPEPPTSAYTFTLYHRDLFEKSKFKDYDSLLRNRIARGRARASYLASFIENGDRRLQRTTTKPTLQYQTNKLSTGESTEIYDADGEHVALFYIGENMNRTYLLVDTTGDIIWWQCGPCDKCYTQNYHPIYDSTASKTFQVLDCVKEGPSCQVRQHFRCTPENQNQCKYDIHYESGTASIGFMASELMKFPVDRTSFRIKFGCGKDQFDGRLQFSGSYSGVVGLGRFVHPESVNVLGAYSLPSQLNVTIISLCLPSFELGKSSTLALGKSQWSRAHKAKLIPNDRFPNLQYVNLYKIIIDDTELPVDPSVWEINQWKRGGVVVDTGTIFTHFPEAIYIKFRNLFRSGVIDVPMVKDPVGDFDTCYRADSEVYFPIVKFYFGSVSPDTELYLVQERVVTLIGDQYCLAFKGWYRDFTIIGTTQLQAFGLTFDTVENNMYFELDACE